jgi:putative endonuclease
MEKGGAMYMLTNQHHTTLYTGVSSDLVSRIVEHREKVFPKSFTAKYNLNKLVYYELFHSIEEAIEREKQLKAGPRKQKEALINKMNP